MHHGFCPRHHFIYLSGAIIYLEIETITRDSGYPVDRLMRVAVEMNVMKVTRYSRMDILKQHGKPGRRHGAASNRRFDLGGVSVWVINVMLSSKQMLICRRAGSCIHGL